MANPPKLLECEGGYTRKSELKLSHLTCFHLKTSRGNPAILGRTKGTTKGVGQSLRRGPVAFRRCFSTALVLTHMQSSTKV